MQRSFANTEVSKPAQKAFFKPATVFPKLTVNQPNDRYEQQADAMADRVMRMEQEEDLLQTKSIGESIQRKCAACGDGDEEMQRMPIMRAGEGSGMEAPPSLANDLSRTKGSGQALPDSTESRMSRAFGTDFSNVRVHTGGPASQMSQSIQAKAFTHGPDIYFNKGQYQPGTSGGDHLLAHELTHVVQQGGDNTSAPNVIQRSAGGAAVGGIIGGLLGGGLGIGVGAALGGVGGAIAGGIIGGLLGTTVGMIAGDSETADERPITGEEETELRKVFGSSLNYGDIRLSFNAPIMTLGGYARTPSNTVYFTSDTAVHAAQKSLYYYSYLVHEVTHVWQYQHGISLGEKLLTALGGEDAYKYGDQAGLEQAISEGKHFGDFNTEQQGDICEDYYRILEGDKDGDIAVWEYFVREVRAGQVLESRNDVGASEAVV